MQRIVSVWRSGWIGKAGLGVGAFVLACCVLGVLAPRSPRDQPGSAARPTSAPTAVVQQVVAVEPTTTPRPTDTPRPTRTPRPTATPAPTATPVPPTPIPEPLILDGSGQSVTDPALPPAALNRVTLTHEGSRNFIVTVYKADGSDDLLVNEIGRYAGVRPLLAEGEVYFEVQADGKWSIRVEPMGQEDGAASLEGTGDYTSGVFVPAKSGPVPYTFTHDGQHNYIVQLYCVGGSDLAQNEIGSVRNAVVVRFADGPCFWEVQADGHWSLKPKS